MLSSDFVRAARASGLSKTTVRVRGRCANARLPVVTTLGMVFDCMPGSRVSSKTGVRLARCRQLCDRRLTAANAPVHGFVPEMGMLFVLLNLVVDLLYMLSDPRISLGAQG